MNEEDDIDKILLSVLQSQCEDDSDCICAICETGGELICCDGKCSRSFHPKCIGLKDSDVPDDQQFICSDCINCVHRCFSCKEFEFEDVLVKCGENSCGKFYHNKVCATI